MKCYKGFTTVFDKDLKRMVPYFMKVRSSDIVMNDELDITEITKYTSERWLVDRIDNNVAETHYRILGEWDSKYDMNSEVVGTDFCRGYLGYHIHKDGRLNLHANLRLSVSNTDEFLGMSAENIIGKYIVYLPISFVEEYPKIQINWSYGTLPGIGISAHVDGAVIENGRLNVSMTDATEYKYKLVIELHRTAGATDSELMTMVQSADPEYGSAGMTFKEYAASFFPFTLNYEGWWRPEPLPITTAPEKYDEDIMGTYQTTGATPMLTRADINTGKVIKYLPGLTEVRCHGYYTVNKTTEVRWFLVYFEGTRDTGYIPETMLTDLM